MLAQPLYGYKCVMCTCTAPMCCHRVCVQGVHSTGHLQHPTQELAIRVATPTPVLCIFLFFIKCPIYIFPILDKPEKKCSQWMIPFTFWLSYHSNDTRIMALHQNSQAILICKFAYYMFKPIPILIRIYIYIYISQYHLLVELLG